MNSGPKNKIGINELKKRAEGGDVEAQSSLGLLYELGIEVPSADAKEAAKWWGMAAKSGNATAQFSLAELLTHNFDDTEENKAMAQALYKKAETGGFMRADKAMRMLDKDSGSAWKVLVVDDATTVRISLKAFLEAEGCEVIEAIDGQDAINILRKTSGIKLVFTDIKMPNMDGFEMIRSMRMSSQWSEIPVVIVTTENSEEAVAMGKKLQVSGWIVKPARPQLIRRHLNKLMSRPKKTKLAAAS